MAMDPFEVKLTKESIGRTIQVVAAVVAGYIVISGLVGSWYVLEARNGEQAVIQRFGRYHATVSESGLHFKLPFGMDTVTIERVQEVRRVEVGFQSAGHTPLRPPGRMVTAKDDEEHSISITRDHNLVDAEYVVQYEISDLKKYLFQSSQPDFTVGQAMKAVIRDIVANRDIDDILTSGRDAMQHEALEAVQKILDAYDIGVRVRAVQFQDVHAPRPVIPAFDDVQKAKEERETLINEGKRYTNTVLPRAEGEAQKIITEAEAYKIRRVNEAKGDALRFHALYERYKKDPVLTRRQLYLQMMAEILPGMDKMIIDGDPGQFLLPVEKGVRK